MNGSGWRGRRIDQDTIVTREQCQRKFDGQVDRLRRHAHIDAVDGVRQLADAILAGAVEPHDDAAAGAE